MAAGPWARLSESGLTLWAGFLLCVSGHVLNTFYHVFISNIKDTGASSQPMPRPSPIPPGPAFF